MSPSIADRSLADAPDPAASGVARPRRGWRAGLVLCVAAAAVLLSVVAHRVPHFGSDVVITRSIQAADVGILGVPMRALNTLGFPPLVGLVYGGIILVLFLSGKRWEAAGGGFAALGGAGINAVVKHLVDRPRPSPLLVHVEHHLASPGYPAGHVLNLTAFAGFLCCLTYLGMSHSWRRSSLIAVLIAMIALMGLARIDAGEHWPSDVLGGYLLGVLWLIVTMRFYAWGARWIPRARLRALASGGGRGAVIALLSFPPLALAGAAHAATLEPDSLGATSEVPWNPPHAMARRQGWEQALLLPGRIVSLPLSALGQATDGLVFLLEQNPRLAIELAHPPGAAAQTVVFRTARMGDRTGLGGAVEVRRDLLHGALESRLSAEYAGTLHQYDRTLLTWTGRPLSLQYGYEWRPQDRFYGVGNASSEDSVSGYASQAEFVRGGLAWESNRERDPARPHSVFSLWGGPRVQVTRDGRERGTPSYATRFPALGAATLDQRVEHLVYGASLMHDRRGGSPHWSRGWHALLSAERFDAPVRALALRSGAPHGAQFTRYQAEAEAGLSFMRDPRTLRLLVRVADQQVRANRDRLLVSDLSTLGGQAGLGGYSPGRFQDLDHLLTRLDYVFPLQRRLEVDLHSEWGAVYPDVWRDAKLTTLHNSFGFSLRARDDRGPRGSIGLDFSREAVRIRFSLGGVE